MIIISEKPKILRVNANLLIRMTDEQESAEDNPDQCPECKTFTIETSPDGSEEYCTRCGLITRASIQYVAGQRIDLPYGILAK